MNESQTSQNKLEQKLEEIFVTKSPIQLPEKARAVLVQSLPWLTLLLGVFMLMGAWALYQLLTFAYNMGVYMSPSYPSATTVSSVGWLSLGLLVAEAVMLFIAFPALKARQKKGWNILLWVSLLSLAYDIVYFIADMNIGSFAFSLLGTALGMFILFQIRGHYLSTKAAAKPAAGPAKQNVTSVKDDGKKLNS